MVRIEKPPHLHFRTVEAVVAVDFQPHPWLPTQEVGKNATADTRGGDPRWRNIERVAAAAGTVVKLWALSFKKAAAAPSDTAGVTQGPGDVVPDANTCAIVSRCVFTVKEHAPHYLVAVRWSPSGSR